MRAAKPQADKTIGSRIRCSHVAFVPQILEQKRDCSQSTSDSVVKQMMFTFEAYRKSKFGKKEKKKAAMLFEQVQRFILVKKIFWG